MAKSDQPHNLRMAKEFYDRADELIEPFRDSEASAAAGNRWGRSAVLRIAIARGLASMEREVAALEERLDGDS